MANSTLIYLAPGAFRDTPGSTPEETLAAATVLFEAEDGALRQAPLDEALVALEGRQVSLVLASTEVLLTGVTLSRKQARHLQRVLPYLLEEQLLENPEALWFTAGKPQHGRYPVAVIDRHRLETLLIFCRERDVTPISLKADADLLAAQAPLSVEVPPWNTLIFDRERALVVEEAQREMAMELYQRGDETELADTPEAEFTRITDADTLFDQLRAAVHGERGVELLQGPFAQRNKETGTPSPWAPWKPVLALAGAVLVVALVSVWAQQWRYQQAADQAYAQAAEQYQALFPNDRATSALRRQFEARLSRLGSSGGGEKGALFAVLPAVAATLSNSDVEPKRLQFDLRDGTLVLDLGAKEYNQVEKLQAALEKEGVKATIANYRDGASGVSARVRVEQAG